MIEDEPSALPLTIADTEQLLRRLGELAGQVILIGGQALNFWAEHYSSRVPELAKEAPFTSKDIDFCGTRELVRRCALKLGGTCKIPDLDDHDVSNSGLVFYVDAHGKERTLDFLSAPFGQEQTDIFESSVHAALLDEHGNDTGTSFRVMHPQRCFEGRIRNEALLKKQGKPHPLKQIRASIHCAREFTRDVLHDDALELKKRTRTALNLNERTFRFCAHNREARRLYTRYGIDPSNAILLDDGLPDAFRQRRYQQIIEWLEQRRVND